MELKKYKLGDIAEIINGSTPSTADADNYDGEIIWITPKDLSDQKSKYIEKGSRNITEKGYNSCSTQMIPSYNILMSSRAPIGLLAINKVDCCTNQGFKNIVVNKSICNVDYLYYYLKFHITEIEALGSGTTFKEVSKASLQKFEISIPSLEIQNKIASTLSNLDQKIALNRQINQNLEEMAKQLYDYWFVQFDFPNDEGKPYKSSGGKMVYNPKLKRQIPDGWECTSLGEIIQELESGKRPKGGIDKTLKEGIPSLGAEAISKLGDFDYAKTPYVPYDTKINSGVIRNNDILVYKDGAYVGKTTLYRDNFPYEYATINEHVFLLRTIDPKMQEYIFFTLQKDYLFEVMQNLGKAKAAQPGLNQDDLKGIEILQPNKEYIYKYKETIEPLLAKLFNNAKEIASLTKQRDELLPLLMNGQVSVAE